MQPAHRKGLNLITAWRHAEKSTDFGAERRLLIAILNDAIECWRSSITFSRDRSYVSGSWQYLDREVHFWIFAEYDNSPFFSFTRICDSLGVDPVFVRRRLLEWRRKIEES